MDLGFAIIHNAIINAHVLIQGVLQQDIDGYEFKGSDTQDWIGMAGALLMLASLNQGISESVQYDINLYLPIITVAIKTILYL